MLLKTFARRNGRSLSAQKKTLLNSLLPDLIFTPNKIASYFNYTEVVLEIGFGMGDHLIHQMQIQPNKFYIGAEVYLPGVANVLNFAYNENIANLALWSDSIDLIIPSIPDNSLDCIFILFPDPWPKRRQHKKRLINQLRLNLFVNKLKNMGKIIFASDIENYVINTKILMENHRNLSVTSNNALTNYIPTKYHKIAISEGRSAMFLTATKSKFA